jgi:2-dehydro-3-deoxy-D-arabinonate dehydratase
VSTDTGLPSAALFRVRLPDGSARLARGSVETGPQTLLAMDWTIDRVLGSAPGALEACLASDGAGSASGLALLPPIENQEVWAAGVTYQRSREARVAESSEPSVYDRVYDAARPELFLKSVGWRVRGPGQTVGIRADSTWDVPEPELTLVIATGGEIVGYAIGNDMSSRSIEGDNPLYLPQAKIYEAACAIGPAIVPASAVLLPLGIHVEIERDGAVVVREQTSSAQLKRTPEELAGYLTRALAFPVGAFLLTGTGAVPPAEFTLRAGDIVRVSIDGLGMLENRVAVVGRAHEDAAGS